MQQPWNLKSRAHECARTARPFTEGETFYTAIYFDPSTGEFVRRDVSLDAWPEETAGGTPFSSWKSEYTKPDSLKPKVELGGKESPETLLRRLVEEDQSHTENARYILALMLERKRQLVPKEIQYTETGSMLLYENRKSGEIYIIKDPELRLDEIEAVQEEVAMLLGFRDPAAGAAPPVSHDSVRQGKMENAGNAQEAIPAAPETADAAPHEARSDESPRPDIAHHPSISAQPLR